MDLFGLLFRVQEHGVMICCGDILSVSSEVDSFLPLMRLPYAYRTFWRHVLLPSTHKPDGDGHTWDTSLADAERGLLLL